MNLPVHQPSTMTSLQIAEVAGKRHCDVMRSIRKMEEAWYKVCGRKFALTFTIIDLPNGATRKDPCYNLTKEECLYIATKFNDEARARLVLRWMELERNQQQKQTEAMADIFAESRRVADDMRKDLADGKILPMDVSLTYYDMAIYAYLRNGIASAKDVPFCVTDDMISKALGIDLENVEAAWIRLERGAYILRRQFGDKYSFILGNRIP